jgi:cell division protein FtsW
MSEALRFPWANERAARERPASETDQPPTPTTKATAAKKPTTSTERRESRLQGRPLPRGARSRSTGTAGRSGAPSRLSILARPRALGTGWSGGLTPGLSPGRSEPASGRGPDRDVARDRLPGRVIEGPQRERHEPDYVLLLAAVALSSIGILMILSSRGVETALRTTGSVVDAVAMQLIWAVIGATVLVVTMRMDYRILRHVSVPAFLLAIALLVLVLMPAIPPLMERKVVGGAARWLSFGGLPYFHPAELAKLALVVYLAHWLASRGNRIRSLREGTIPFLLIAGPVIALVAVEPDLGTTGVVTLMAFTMFFVAGASLWHLGILVPVGVVAVAFALRSYQMDRIETFMDPWKVATEEGYQTVQGLLSLGLGGLFGTGLGESNPHAGGLSVPNSANDFIFAIVGQELGLVGGLTVITLFALIAWRGVRVALGAPDTFGALLALGVTSWLAFQAFINIGVVVHLLPLTGVPLPFVSDGGSSLIVSLAAVGILLAISRETSRGSQTDEDHRGGRWHRRPHLPGLGRRATPVRHSR